MTTQKRKEEIKQLCIDGLLTDGAHHKQWFLEQILIKLGYNLEKINLELLMDDYAWDEGVAP